MAPRGRLRGQEKMVRRHARQRAAIDDDMRKGPLRSHHHSSHRACVLCFESSECDALERKGPRTLHAARTTRSPRHTESLPALLDWVMRCQGADTVSQRPKGEERQCSSIQRHRGGAPPRRTRWDIASCSKCVYMRCVSRFTAILSRRRIYPLCNGVNLGCKPAPHPEEREAAEEVHCEALVDVVVRAVDARLDGPQRDVGRGGFDQARGDDVRREADGAEREEEHGDLEAVLQVVVGARVLELRLRSEGCGARTHPEKQFRCSGRLWLPAHRHARQKR